MANKEMEEIREMFRNYKHEDLDHLLHELIDWKDEKLKETKSGDVKAHEKFMLKIADLEGDHYCEVCDYDNMCRVYELIEHDDICVFAIEDITELL